MSDNDRRHSIARRLGDGTEIRREVAPEHRRCRDGLVVEVTWPDPHNDTETNTTLR